MSIIIMLLVVVLIIVGLPLFAAIGIASIFQFINADINPVVVIVELYRLASAPTLLAIPLFTLAGYILAESKAPQRLLNLAEALIGWLPGGLAIVALVTCAFFTCFTGASGITIVAIGGLIYPILINNRYSDRFTLGLITSSGSLGLLFPPSLPLILYGVVGAVAIDRLFLAGIVPGVILILILSIYAVTQAKEQPLNYQRFSWNRAWVAIKDVIWELPIPVIILGGIYSGTITAVEASAATAFYVLVIEFFVQRDLSIKQDLIRIMRDSVQLIGGILIILSCSMGMTAFLIDAQVPQKVLTFIQHFISSRLTFLLLLNIFLLITGALLDIFSAIIIVVPLITPIALSYGVDPVHLGIIFLTNLEIGYITPPIGLNLFIASFRFNRPIDELYRISIPFLILMLLALVLITYIPDLSLGLVRLFNHP